MRVIFYNWGGWLAMSAALAIMAIPWRSTAAEVTLGTLLSEMTNYEAMARWPSPEFTAHQCSSYDRREVAPDKPGWFANNDFSQYIREENHGVRHEQVMMDTDGPGCIVRFWLTTVKNKKGTIRVYLDGSDEPTLVFPAYDLLSGDLNLTGPLDQPHPGYSPTDNGGNTLGLPIPYAKHCKVTWEEAGDGPRYYQIDYRTYAPGTVVKTFTRNDLEAARPLIDAVQTQLLSPSEVVGQPVVLLDQAIPTGGQAAVDLPAGPAAVEWLQAQVKLPRAVDQEQALRSVVLKIDFDGEPAVWCPIADFFGSGVGINALQSWYRTVKADGVMTCRWVMPYARSGRVTILNLGKSAAQVSLKAGIGAWTWDERSMHFHAAWHYDGNLKTPPVRDWNGVKVTGRGVYVGDTLALFNYIPTWYGEGDEKIWVDQDTFPSFAGTGMEDYYDFSFAPRGLMQTPFANQVRVDQPMTQGNNVLTRTRNLDGIPFEQSLDFYFELISWQPTRLVYAMTTYWYAFPGVRCNVAPQPEAATRPVPKLWQAMRMNSQGVKKP